LKNFDIHPTVIAEIRFLAPI